MNKYYCEGVIIYVVMFQKYFMFLLVTTSKNVE